MGSWFFFLKLLLWLMILILSNNFLLHSILTLVWVDSFHWRLIDISWHPWNLIINLLFFKMMLLFRIFLVFCCLRILLLVHHLTFMTIWTPLIIFSFNGILVIHSFTHLKFLFILMNNPDFDSIITEIYSAYRSGP